MVGVSGRRAVLGWARVDRWRESARDDHLSTGALDRAMTAAGVAPVAAPVVRQGVRTATSCREMALVLQPVTAEGRWCDGDRRRRDGTG
jgi:hypothetical protein